MKKTILLLGIFILLLAISVSARPEAVLLDGPANCQEANDMGYLYGSITTETGLATVTNDAPFECEVGLAVYYKFDEIIDNQIIYDWDTTTVPAGQTVDLEVDLPDCKYQIDLFEGEVLFSLDGIRYGDRKLDWEHKGGPDYCDPEVPEFGTIAAGIAVVGAIAGFAIVRKKK